MIMRAFQDYEIAWNGKAYVIPANALLPVIAAVEEHITFTELLTARVRELSLARLSQAYAVILRAVGAKGADGKALITEQEVYLGMFEGGDLIARVKAAIEGLLGLMIPPEDVQAEPAGQAMPGKPQAASRPSKASTRRSLARIG